MRNWSSLGGGALFYHTTRLEWQVMPFSYHYLSYRAWIRLTSFLHCVAAITYQSRLAILLSSLHPSPLTLCPGWEWWRRLTPIDRTTHDKDSSWVRKWEVLAGDSWARRERGQAHLNPFPFRQVVLAAPVGFSSMALLSVVSSPHPSPSECTACFLPEPERTEVKMKSVCGLWCSLLFDFTEERTEVQRA